MELHELAALAYPQCGAHDLSEVFSVASGADHGYRGVMDDAAMVSCPWCGELQELWLDPQTEGEMIQDCDVCCRPWRVFVSRDEHGDAEVQLDRA